MKKFRRKVVKVNLMGGLGNQLLQYATALNLSRALETRLILNSFLLSRSPINSSAEQRKLEIMQFAHSGDIQNLGKFYTLKSMILGRIGWLIFRRPILGNLWIRTPDFFFELRKLKNQQLHITGFFTSYLYFQDILQTLRDELSDVYDPSQWFSTQLREFEDQDFYAIHVRRGDYETLSDHFGLLTSAYYLSALTHLINLSGEKNVYVFSDDIAKAQLLFNDFPFEIKFIEPPPDSSALESLILMSKSNGLVIANSTYSWWAGLLSKSEASVLYPQPFINNEKFETKDFFPNNWVPIKHTY